MLLHLRAVRLTCDLDLTSIVAQAPTWGALGHRFVFVELASCRNVRAPDDDSATAVFSAHHAQLLGVFACEVLTGLRATAKDDRGLRLLMTCVSDRGRGGN